MFPFLLPFLGSGFAPTDSRPAAMRWFAEHQPFTPFTETLRGLLLGMHIGGDAIATVGWTAATAEDAHSRGADSGIGSLSADRLEPGVEMASIAAAAD